MGNTPNMVLQTTTVVSAGEVVAKLFHHFPRPWGNYHSWTKKMRPSENTDRQALGKLLRKLVADR